MTRRETRRRALSPRALEARKFAAIGQLASGIAHEINTPTQYIGDNLRFLLDAFRELAALLPADAVERGHADPELAYLLEEIPSAVAQSLDGVAQVSRMVGATKRFATARVGQVALLDLNEAIESVLTIAHHEWKFVARVARDLDATLPLVPCAEAELKQVILSLVLHAARAIGTAALPVPGTISVVTRHDPSFVTVSVGDTGDPIADALFLHRYDATVMVGTSERARALTFARDLVVEQGGVMRVASAAGQGTTVVVRLPIRGGAAQEPFTSASGVEPHVDDIA